MTYKPKTTKQLAAELGVGVGWLKELRKSLQQGKHWARDPNDQRSILWSMTGENAVRDALALVPAAPAEPQGTPLEHLPPDAADALVSSMAEAWQAEPAAPAFDTTDPDPEPEALLVTVTSKASKPGTPHFPNERVVKVRADDGRELTVWVHSSRNFQPQLQGGAPMTCTVTMRGGRWELAQGWRCPRWPGKW